MIAAASSRGVALGMCSLPEVDSAKIGRISTVQSGQMAGAGELRFAARIPVTNVPCRQAMLSARVHPPPSVPRNLAEALAGQIGMSREDRPIDDANRHFRAPAGALHQRYELD